MAGGPKGFSRHRAGLPVPGTSTGEPRTSTWTTGRLLSPGTGRVPDCCEHPGRLPGQEMTPRGWTQRWPSWPPQAGLRARLPPSMVGGPAAQPLVTAAGPTLPSPTSDRLQRVAWAVTLHVILGADFPCPQHAVITPCGTGTSMHPYTGLTSLPGGAAAIPVSQVCNMRPREVWIPP